MGKRSNFERRERDFYETPRVAVEALIPHLRGVHSFAEPCAGGGALVNHLESFGLRCVYAGDISSGQDALALDHYGDIDAIVTNPPYTRPLMHALIAHLARIAPTWLLLESDWASTKQAVPFMSMCSNIAAIGRVKWIPGSKHTGKDNFGWFRFDAHHSAGPIFHARESVPVTSHAFLCMQCNRSYRPQRSSSKFCSDSCRQRSHRSRLTQAAAPLSVTKRDIGKEPAP